MNPGSPPLPTFQADETETLRQLQILAGNPGDEDALDQLIGEVLSTGRLQTIRRLILETAGPIALELELLAADAGVRVQAVAPPQLQRLFALVDQAQDPNLSLWLAAVSAECHIWSGDLAGVSIAHAGLADAGSATRAVGRIARARLRRLVALAATLAGESGAQTAEQMRLEACSDFEQEGQVEELAITAGMFAIIRVISGTQPAERGADDIRRAAEVVQVLRSDRAPLVYLGLAWAAAIGWDFVELSDILTRLDGVLEGDVGPIVYDLIAIVKLAADLEQNGATPELLEHTQQLFEQARRSLRVLPTAALYIATILLDSGEWEAAGDLVDTATSSTMMFTHYTEISIREIGARLRLLRDHNELAVEDLLATAAMWRDAGHVRHAAQACLRGALDCERAGFRDEGALLRSRGVELLPPISDRSAWEISLLTRAVDAADQQTLGEVRVMGDDLIVECRGDPIPLSGVSARMLALLVACRYPVSTDWLIETLWPNVDPHVGRSRLKTNLWRLRKQLGLERHDLVARTREGVALLPGSLWRVDLWEFYTLAAGTQADQLRAISSMSPELCDRQFRYDEQIGFARTQLRDRWSALALSLLRVGAISVDHLAERLLDTRLDNEEVVHETAARLQQSGSPLATSLTLRAELP